MRDSITTRTIRPLVGAIALFEQRCRRSLGAFPATTPPRPADHVPSATLAPTTAPTPTPTPTQPATARGRRLFVVDLKTLDGDHDVSGSEDRRLVDFVVEATSGNPGDGMSVRWFDVKVENVDDRTLRVVWVGLARDEVVHLGIARVDGKIRLSVRPGRPARANSDAVGFDRVLDLKFVVPVRSEDVLTSVQEGLETTD